MFYKQSLLKVSLKSKKFKIYIFTTLYYNLILAKMFSFIYV